MSSPSQERILKKKWKECKTPINYLRFTLVASLTQVAYVTYMYVNHKDSTRVVWLDVASLLV